MICLFWDYLCRFACIISKLLWLSDLILLFWGLGRLGSGRLSTNGENKMIECIETAQCIIEYLKELFGENDYSSAHFYRKREEGGSGRPPPTVHLRTDDVT